MQETEKLRDDPVPGINAQVTQNPREFQIRLNGPADVKLHLSCLSRRVTYRLLDYKNKYMNVQFHYLHGFTKCTLCVCSFFYAY